MRTKGEAWAVAIPRIEPTTAVVRDGKRSLRARITAREALSGSALKRDLKDLKAGSVCMYVRLFGTVL